MSAKTLLHWDVLTSASNSVCRALSYGKSTKRWVPILSGVLATCLSASADAQTPIQLPVQPQANGYYVAPTPSSSPNQTQYQTGPVPTGPTQGQGVVIGDDSLDYQAPLDGRISAMPQNQQKLQVIHRRSQLVKTHKRISRFAWSDPSLLDIVQYTDHDFGILATNYGSTDLWLWFEEEEGKDGKPPVESTTPLMYNVTVIRDPDIEDRRKIDYGRVERVIKVLYPNSNVMLLPLTNRIIVRGQARDPEEASRIMGVIRSEVAAEEATNRNGFGLNGANGGYGGNLNGGIGGAGGIGGIGGNGNNGLGGGGDLFSQLIVNELTVPGEFQVSVRIRFAELNRTQLRRMGVDWTAIFNQGGAVISSTMGAVPVLSGVFSNGEVTVLLDALATNSSARVVTDQNIVTLSGRPAAFLAGGEFAVPTTVGVNGVGAATTTFRGYGTSVIVVPTVVDNDLFRLQIVPEISKIDSGTTVGGIPGLSVSRVQTQVELREGQTIVLGGLFGRKESASNTRIPLLGEIPVIGEFLFHTKRATEDENELILLATPEIVRAMDADQVPPLPGHYVTHPDDFDFFKYNRIEGNPDLGHYQLLPFGNGQGPAHDVGHNFYNPNPADRQIAPQATGGVADPAYGQPGLPPYSGGAGMSPTPVPQVSPAGQPISQTSGQMPSRMPSRTPVRSVKR
jgi:pilus assembly protein CpaC